MKNKIFMIIPALLLLLTFQLSSCSLEYVFEQPEVTVKDFDILEISEAKTILEIKIDVKNIDNRDGDVVKLTYKAEVEGIKSEDMSLSKHFSIDSEKTITKSLPLNMPTKGAVSLLDKLEKGTPLNYKVTGEFTVFTFFGEIKLPLNVNGQANLIKGKAEFFEQPKVNAKDFNVVDINAEKTEISITVEIINSDPNDAKVSDLIYNVEVEDTNSEEMTYTNNIHIDSGETIILVLPLIMPTQGAVDLLDKLDSGTDLKFAVKGKFTTHFGSISIPDLPLDVNGVVALVKGKAEFFKQPEISVKDFNLTDINETNITLLITVDVKNIDPMNAEVSNLSYIADVEDVISENMDYLNIQKS